jgi:predicted transcriptional regulator
MKLLEEVAKARDQRAKAESTFLSALVRAREKGDHSWTEIGEAAGLSRYTVRYYVLGLNERRRERSGA